MDSARDPPDYYEILKVDSTADSATIKKSYRHLARLKHPDKNLNNPLATAEFQKLEAAYSTLGDPKKRKAYDLAYPNIHPKPKPHGHGHSFTSTPTSSRETPARPEPSRQPDSSYHRQSSDQEPDVTPQEREELDKAWQVLCQRHHNLQKNLEQAKMEFRKAEAAFFKQQRDNEREEREEARSDTWAGYFRSFTLSAEERSRAKELRARRARERVDAMRHLATERDRCDDKVDVLFRQMYDLEAEVEKAREQLSSADRRAPGRRERLAREYEIRRREGERRYAEYIAEENERQK